MKTARCGCVRQVIQTIGSDGRGDGHQDTHVGSRPDSVGRSDLTDQHVARLRRDALIVSGQKLTGSLDDCDADLAIDLMGMDRKFLTRLEVEIENFEVFRIMDQQGLEGDIVEASFVEEIDRFHRHSL